MVESYDGSIKPRILSVSNQKGGVGKTTTAINLGTALAAIGENVLIIDLDSQGNASTGLGVYQENRHLTILDVLDGHCSLHEIVVETIIPKLLLAPSTMDLSGLELAIAKDDDRALKLSKALEAFYLYNGSVEEPITYILIDCPPSLNVLTVNAMAASDAVLVPLQCEFFALEGLTQLVKTISGVKNTLNPHLSIHGVVLTMFDQRNKLSKQVEEDVRRHMGAKVYQTIIPRNVRLSEAPSHGRPALIYDMKCPGSQAYLNLAQEVIERERLLKAA